MCSSDLAAVRRDADAELRVAAIERSDAASERCVAAAERRDRKSVVEGKSGDLGESRSIKRKKSTQDSRKSANTNCTASAVVSRHGSTHQATQCRGKTIHRR